MAPKTKKSTAVQHTSQASARYARISARKARLVVDLVRGRQVEQALNILQFVPRKGARIIEKLLRSAMFNAKETRGADVDALWVTGCWVDEAGAMKRFMPRARGRATPIRKPFAHITVCVGERQAV